MADHSTTTTRFTGPDTPDAFLADRQRFWNGFTHAATASVITAAVVLILMAWFL